MKNNKKVNKICFILNTMSSLLFTFTGIANLVNKGFTQWMGIAGIALGITFGSLAFIYYKKYKEEK